MTSASAREQEQTKPPIPVWVGPAVLALGVAAVGWFIWWYLVGSMPRQRTVEVDPALVRQESGRVGMERVAARMRRQEPGVQNLRDNEWLVSTAGGAMRISRDNTGYQVRLLYTSGLLTDEQQRVLTAQMRLVRDDAMARQVGLKPEQSKKLRAISMPAMKVDDAQRERMKAMWMSYVHAPEGPKKTEEQKKMVAALDEVGKAALEPTRQVVAERISEITAIITPQVLEKLSGKAR